MLSLQNLSLYRNSNKIFDDISCSIMLGTCLIIHGQNGSGKTSLLKIIAGISKQTSGKIFLGDDDVDSIRSDFNYDLQFIGHKNFLKSDLTVFENLRFYTSLYDSNSLISAALSFFKIAKYRDEKIKNLSAGMQKKVMLAKLMCCPAKFWILDEPTVNLDSEGKRLLKGLIKTKLENQGIVIISSHEPDFFEFGAKLLMEDFSQ
jgi:heme exporter protein A